MADGSDDMNATPLNKLPPPILQSKQNQAPVDAPNYRDLLNDMDKPQPALQPLPQPNQLAPMQSMQQPMPQQQGVQVPQPMQQPVYNPYAPQPPQLAPQLPQLPLGEGYGGGAYGYDQRGSYGYDPRGYEDAFAQPRDDGFLKRFIRSNKTTLTVVAIVLLTLMFVVPRLSKVPRFATFEGQLNLLGKVAAAAIAGGAYRITLLAL